MISKLIQQIITDFALWLLNCYKCQKTHEAWLFPKGSDLAFRYRDGIGWEQMFRTEVRIDVKPQGWRKKGVV